MTRTSFQKMNALDSVLQSACGNASFRESFVPLSSFWKAS